MTKQDNAEDGESYKVPTVPLVLSDPEKTERNVGPLTGGIGALAPELPNPFNQFIEEENRINPARVYKQEYDPILNNAEQEMKEIEKQLAPSGGVSAPSRRSNAPSKEEVDTILNFGNNTAANAEALRAVQQGRNQDIMANRLGMAAETIGANIAGLGSGQGPAKITGKEFYEQGIKLAENQVKDYEDKLKMEKQDPTSSYSQGMREFLKKNFNIDALGASAEQIATILPAAQKQYEKNLDREAQQENMKFKYAQLSEIAKQARQNRIDAREETKNTRLELQDNNTIFKINKQRESGGSPALQQLRKNKTITDNIFLTYGVDPTKAEKEINKIDPKTLDSASRLAVVEGAMELTKALGGGSVAVSNLKKALPNNVAFEINGLTQFLTSNPTGAEQGKFIKEYLKISARLRDSAERKELEHTKDVLTGSDAVLKRRPEEILSIARRGGLTIEELKKSKIFNEKTLDEALQKIGYDSTKEISNKATTKKESNVISSPVSKVRMIAPNGKEVLVPSSQVQAAIKAGGKVVE